MMRVPRIATSDRSSQVGALLAGLALRSLFVWKHPRFVGDTLIYGDLAHNLLAHHVYGLTENGHVRATLIRLPGYPLFLALCFVVFGTGQYLPVLWVQVFVDLLSCWLLGRLAARVFRPETGRAAIWLAALCPFTANYVATALTETLSIFCVVLAFFGFTQWLQGWRPFQAAALTGAALCGAVLLRPDGILLAGAVLPPMLSFGWHRSRGAEQPGWWTGPAVSGGAILLCLGVWTARNWQVYHVIQPLAPKYANDPGETEPLGFAQWYRTWAAGLQDTARVYWEYDGDVLQLNDLPPWAIDNAAERAETERVYALYNAETSSTPAIEAAFSRLAVERQRHHPVRSFVAMPLIRLGDMWLRPRTELMRHMPLAWWDYHRRPRAAMFALGYGLLNLALLMTAVTGLLRWLRTGWRGLGALAAAMVGYVVLRSALLITIDNSEPRYVLECYPVVLVLAAVALSGALRSQQMEYSCLNQ